MRQKSLPWVTREIRALMRAHSYWLTKARKSKLAEDWVQYRKMRNLVTRRLREAKVVYFEELCKQSRGNPRKAWKEVNRLLGGGCKRQISSVKTEGGSLTDQQDIAEAFATSHRWSGCLRVKIVVVRCVGGYQHVRRSSSLTECRRRNC